MSVNFVAADAYVLPHGKFCMNGALTEETPDLETYGDNKPLSSVSNSPHAVIQ